MIVLVYPDHVGAAAGTHPKLIDTESRQVNSGPYIVSELLPPHVRIIVFEVYTSQRSFEDEMGCELVATGRESGGKSREKVRETTC